MPNSEYPWIYKQQQRFETDENIRFQKELLRLQQKAKEKELLANETRLAKDVYLRATAEGKNPEVLLNEIRTNPAYSTSAIQNFDRLKAEGGAMNLPSALAADKSFNEYSTDLNVENRMGVPAAGIAARERDQTSAVQSRFERNKTLGRDPTTAAEAANASDRSTTALSDLNTVLSNAARILGEDKTIAQDTSAITDANLATSRNVKALPNVQGAANAEAMQNRAAEEIAANQLLRQQSTTPADIAAELELLRAENAKLLRLNAELTKNPRYMNPPSAQEVWGEQMSQGASSAIPQQVPNFPPGTTQALPVAPQRPRRKLEELYR